jgi:sulfur carrier protein
MKVLQDSRSEPYRGPGCGSPAAAAISYCAISGDRATLSALVITLNGDRFELAGPVTVSSLLARLDIDARRVAVEHNLVVLKRAAFDTTVVHEGDQVEIVNFVGGG